MLSKTPFYWTKKKTCVLKIYFCIKYANISFADVKWIKGQTGLMSRVIFLVYFLLGIFSHFFNLFVQFWGYICNYLIYFNDNLFIAVLIISYRVYIGVLFTVVCVKGWCIVIRKNISRLQYRCMHEKENERVDLVC